MAARCRLILLLVGILVSVFTPSAFAVIRDGGIDPANLGKGEWIFSIRDATNKLGGHIASVTNEVSMFQYFKSIGVRYLLVKAGTGSTNYSGCSPFANQVTSTFCNQAHANGIWIFAYTRSYGSDIAGESALADTCFQSGADGFCFDAEAEWESNKSWITTNGPALAWQLCSMVRSNWPTKFIAHAPMPIIYGHSSFPYKEFGYWCDAVFPQIYHFSTAGLHGSPSAIFNWSDVNWRTFQTSLLSLPQTNINGVQVNWANAIKPLVPVHDIYGPTIAGGLLCNGGTSANPDLDVTEFIDYGNADPNCVTTGGYQGVTFWRADLHGATQFNYIKAGTSGNIGNVVNNIVMDDASATVVGGWTPIKVFGATPTSPTFYGDPAVGGTDDAPFGTNYWIISKGTGSAYMQFTPKVVVAGDYDIYQWHVNRSDASASVPAIVRFDAGTNTVILNQTTNAGTWSFIGRFPFASGTSGSLQITDGFSETSGEAMVDGFKMIFVPPAAVPTAPTNLIATAVSSNQIALTWTDRSTNETGFAVLRSTVNGGPYTGLASVGRNATNYTDSSVTAGITYYYVVRGTNYLGASTNSNQATPPIRPSITVQPQSITVAQGGTASFTVAAIGTAPLTYKWLKDGNGLVDGGTISGSSTTNLIIANVQQLDGGNYSVIVSNSVGTTNSIIATLTIATVPPFVVTQPSSITVNAGTTASFTVVANGTAPLGFQWKKNGSAINGATLSTLTLPNVLRADQAGYSVTITNQFGTTNSNTATLTVIDPAVLTPPAALTVLAGQTAVFSVTAGGTPALTYSWKKNNVLMVNGGKISGATTANLTITNAFNADAADYTVVVSNSFGFVTSPAAHLTVIDPVITAQPVSRTNVAGTTATFSVSAVGTTPLNYIWKKGGAVLANGLNVSGATTSTLTISNVSQADATLYSVTVSNSVSSQISSNASLTVIDPPSISSQPQSQTVVRGTNVVFNVVATGTAPLSYQWRWNGTNIIGATKSTHSLNNVQTNSSGLYSVVINNAGGTLSSSNALLVVNVPFEIFNLLPAVRANSVAVNWATTSNSTSQVEYGLTPEMGYLSPLVTTPVTNHSILLTSLKPDTTYYFRVSSTIGPVTITSNSTVFTTCSVVVDNPDASYNGFWTLGQASTDKYGTYYQYTTSSTNGVTSYADYRPNLVLPGDYDIYGWWGSGGNRSTNTMVLTYANSGSVTSRVDQTTNAGLWNLITTGQNFTAGTNGYVRIANNTGETNRVVVADAIMWQYDVTQDIRTNGTVPDWWATYYFGTTNINAAADTDSDGYSTFSEYVLGTVPNSSSSRLDFRVQSVGANLFQATFTPCAAGRQYTLQYTTNLGSGLWLSAPTSVSLSNGVGVATATNPTGQKAFYRLSVSLAP